MLLLLPRIDDYTGGYTMLGLGDIVLPGLLVAFACRYDVARGARIPYNFILMVRCLISHSHITPVVDCSSSVAPFVQSYSLDILVGLLRCMAYTAQVIGYAVGLMMANVAVYVMAMGQPALLYLVPCTLGVLSLKASRCFPRRVCMSLCRVTRSLRGNIGLFRCQGGRAHGSLGGTSVPRSVGRQCGRSYAHACSHPGRQRGPAFTHSALSTHPVFALIYMSRD